MHARRKKTDHKAAVNSPGLVLVVEDDRELARRVKRTLEKDPELSVAIAHTGLDALSMATERLPHVVLLDLGLPDLDGTEVCRHLRTRTRTAHIPIIIVSERASEQDRLTAFNLGADDYVIKPFFLTELQARVRVALRRAQPPPARLNSYKGLHIAANFANGILSVDGAPVKLTRREFDLLWYLAEHRDQVVPPGRLLKAVWGRTTNDDTRTLSTHIARLRAKLGPAGWQIDTFLRKGYRFTETTE